MSFCVKCGENLEDGDLFCGNCGQPLQSSTAQTVSTVDIKRVFIDYLKYPVSTTTNLIYSLEMKFTIILSAIILLLTALIPFKPIKSAVSSFTKAFSLFGDTSELKGVSSKVNGLYFTFLLYAILFFALSTLLVLGYGAIRGKKEGFRRIVNLVVLSSIPAVLFLVLASLLFGLNSFSLILIIFGLILSLIIFYTQLKQVLALTELDSFIASVIVIFLSYGITFYALFTTLEAKIKSLNMF